MARWYLPLKSELKEEKSLGGAVGGGMERGQDIDHPNVVKIPPMFGGGTVELKPGGIAFGFVDYGFYHTGPGEYVDIPDQIPVKCIRLMAPQLLNKEQAIKAGLCHEDGSLKASPRAKSRDPQPTQ